MGEMCAVRVAILVTVDALMREMCAVRGAILVLEPRVAGEQHMGGGGVGDRDTRSYNYIYTCTHA